MKKWYKQHSGEKRIKKAGGVLILHFSDNSFSDMAAVQLEDEVTILQDHSGLNPGPTTY